MLSSSTAIQRLLWKALLDRNYVVIPLYANTKRPLVTWQAYTTTPPSRDEQRDWFHRFPSAHPSILAGAGSGIYCLDHDTPPYPPSGRYTRTPRGGRHYWYPYRDGIRLGSPARSGLDIPYLVKIYALPIVNQLEQNPRQRRTPDYRPPGRTNPLGASTDSLPPDAFDACAFVRWFNEQKLNPAWDGRYFLARAFASNIYIGTGQQPSLGPDYQHQQQIYNSLTRPITCTRIVEYGFHCPHYDPDSRNCSLNQNARSPYGLAAQNRNT